MSKKLSFITLVIVVSLFGLAAFNVLTTQKVNSVKPLPTPVSLASEENPYADWKIFRNGYSIKLPPKWKNTSDVGGRATFVPGERIGLIDGISITFLSDKKVKPHQQFTTQQEFDEWYEQSGQNRGKIQKINNIFVDGQKAIMLLDTSGALNIWNIITWVRRDNTNLYINAIGTGKYDAIELDAVSHLASSFTFSEASNSANNTK